MYGIFTGQTPWLQTPARETASIDFSLTEACQERIQIQYRMWIFKCHLGINVYKDLSNRQRNVLVAEKFPSFTLFLSVREMAVSAWPVSSALVPGSRTRLEK